MVPSIRFTCGLSVGAAASFGSRWPRSRRIPRLATRPVSVQKTMSPTRCHRDARTGAEGLFRHDFGQDHMLVGILEGGACRGKRRHVGRVDVAGAGEILLLAFGVGGDRDRLVAHVVDAGSSRRG